MSASTSLIAISGGAGKLARIVRFGNHRFDRESGRLWHRERELKVSPRASAVLALLLSRAGEPVTKDEFFATVWEGTAVSDDALTARIQELRKVLGDDPRHPRIIETRHRRGYRFLSPLAGELPRMSLPDEWLPQPLSVAVLPFADMSPEGDQGYLCDGLAEELISVLARLRGVRVAARTASFRFRGGEADVRALGERLGVSALIEGGVRKAAQRLRITVQLVDTATGYHRWSRQFDGTVDDVFAVQEEMARSVAALMKGEALRFGGPQL